MKRDMLRPLERKRKIRVCPVCKQPVAVAANPTDNLNLGMYCAYCETCDLLIKLSDTEVK